MNALPSDKHTITRIGPGPDTSNPMATTAQPHGLTEGQTVTISGSSIAAYNGVFQAGLSLAPGPGFPDDVTVSFMLVSGGAEVADAGTASGGRWD